MPPPPRTLRIAPLEHAEDAPVSLTGTERNGGRPLNIFLTLAKHPDLMRRFNGLGGLLLTRGLLPAREREIVILRIGWRSESVYEFGQHTEIGRSVGLTQDEVRRLAHADVDGWSDRDAGLVRMSDELCAHNVVSEATWAVLAESWSEQQLMELLVLAGFYRLVSGFLNSVGVQLEPTMPGWPAT